MPPMRAPAWYITWRSRFAPARWRWTRVILSLYAGMALTSLAYLAVVRANPIDGHSNPPANSTPTVGFLTLTAMFGIMVLSPFITMAAAAACMLMDYRWRSRARTLQGRMCGNCLHDLRGLGDAGHCPECGHPFSLDQLRRYWKGVEIPPTPVP